MIKQRKTPLRRCTGCFEMKSKKELVRVVHSADNTFSVDTTGKMSGRGAYICPNAECLAAAVKRKGLERSFKQAVPKDVYEKLKKELQNIDEQTNGGASEPV